LQKPGQAPEITERVILFRIPRLWSPEMPAEELYETTQGWWTLGRRRNGADYAFAVNRRVIREVYRIGESSPFKYVNC